MNCNPVDTSLVLLAAVRVGVVVGDVLRGSHGTHRLRVGMVGLWKRGGRCHEVVEGTKTRPFPPLKEKKSAGVGEGGGGLGIGCEEELILSL